MGKILKSSAALVTGLALAVSVSATAELPASAATSCSVSLNTYKTVRAGTKGSQARAAECALRKAGQTASVNGSFSTQDAAKLARFQRSVGLAPTKAVNSRTWTALLSRGSRPALKRGNTGASVLRLQRSLRALGYSKVTLTSYFGANTQAAVKSVQKQRRLKQTGVTSTALWSALQHGKVAAVKKPAAKKPAAKKPAARPAASSGNKGARALAFAKNQLGEPYRYAGSGPNAWDCSGLTSGAWKSVGVNIPRLASAQYRGLRKISKSQLQPGDLVFFYSPISHVGIYAGGGQVIHASRPGKPVAYIKMSYMPYAGAVRPS